MKNLIFGIGMFLIFNIYGRESSILNKQTATTETSTHAMGSSTAFLVNLNSCDYCELYLIVHPICGVDRKQTERYNSIIFYNFENELVFNQAFQHQLCNVNVRTGFGQMVFERDT